MVGAIGCPPPSLSLSLSPSLDLLLSPKNRIRSDQGVCTGVPHSCLSFSRSASLSQEPDLTRTGSKPSCGAQGGRRERLLATQRRSSHHEGALAQETMPGRVARSRLAERREFPRARVLPRQYVGGGKFHQSCAYARSPLLKITALNGKLSFGDRFLDSGVVGLAVEGWVRISDTSLVLDFVPRSDLRSTGEPRP